jgi:two-component system, cell cycle response regulator
LKSACREEDIVARYGGEEFVILLPETDLEGTRAVAQRIHDEIRKLYVLPDRSITLSIGVASYPSAGVKDVMSLIKCADQALYSAKNAGRNQTVYYSPE